MQYVLITLAFTIGIMYFPYLIFILAGRSHNFETRAVLSLAAWIRQTGPKARRNIENVFVAATLLEVTYFSLVILVINNTFLLGLTVAFIIFEAIHLAMGYLHLRRFFQGLLPIKDFLAWKYERISCLLFVLHAILVIVNLLNPT